MSRRGTEHRNETGNSYDRRRRRARIWNALSVDGQIKCHHCPQLMSKEEFQIDRFPLCGHNGGRYVIGNTVPSCAKCNRDRCTVVCGKGVAAKHGALDYERTLEQQKIFDAECKAVRDEIKRVTA